MNAVLDPVAATLTPPAHGEIWPGQGGRYICTLPALLGMPERHLIVSEGEAEGLEYGPYGVDVPGAGSPLNGPGNTQALIDSGKDHPAAQWARAYTADGHSDFHLPAKLDLVMAQICAPQLFSKDDWYWSSTQYSSFNAFVQDFEYGVSHWNIKDDERRVRAFRWVHLSA